MRLISSILILLSLSVYSQQANEIYCREGKFYSAKPHPTYATNLSIITFDTLNVNITYIDELNDINESEGIFMTCSICYSKADVIYTGMYYLKIIDRYLPIAENRVLTVEYIQ